MNQSFKIYQGFHKNTRNQLTHIIGVPLVVLAAFIFFASFRFRNFDGPLFSGANLVYILVMTYYAQAFGFRIAFIAALFNLPILILANYIANLEFQSALALFVGIFIVGWAVQFIGHYFEGKKPALFQDISQTVNGPIFILEHLKLIKLDQ